MTDEKIQSDNSEDFQLDEWVSTPEGNYSIDVDIEHDVIQRLVTIWVHNNLDPASVEKYESDVALSDPNNDYSKALYAAVQNDIIIAAIKAQIDLAAERKNEPTDSF